MAQDPSGTGKPEHIRELGQPQDVVTVDRYL